MPDAPSGEPHDHAVVNAALRGALTTAYQPIVDLEQGRVVGYEALMRYRGQESAAPMFSAGEMLASARRIGRAIELETAALGQALSVRDELPLDSFLSVNVTASSLLDERIPASLLAQGSLLGVVIELVDDERVPIADLRQVISDLHDRGADIAVADTSMSPDALADLLQVGADYMKLDRRLVAGVAESRTKLAVVSSLRHLAEQMDMGVIAQGIEKYSDLRTLERLGVYLGQGFLLARPSSISAVPTSVPLLVERKAAVQRADDPVQGIADPVAELTEAELDQPLPDDHEVEFEVIITELGEPLALLRRDGRRVIHVPLTVVEGRLSLREAARVALRRQPERRFDPMVCVDPTGGCAGVVRIDRLLDALSRTVPPTADDERRRQSRGRHHRR